MPNLLHYHRSGHGFPVVLVHGFLGGAAHWRDLIAHLSHHHAGRFDCIAIDLPGFGTSNSVSAIDRIPDFAGAVLAFLSALKIDQFHLLGHSMGGMICQDMAIIAPERVKGLVLYGTGPVGVLPNRFETLQQSKDRIAKDGVASLARFIASTWFLRETRDPAYLEIATIAEMAGACAVVKGLEAMAHWNGVENLNRIRQPVQIIWGEHDRSYGFSEQDLLWQSIADASLCVLPRCAHIAHLEQRALFAHVLTDFLGTVA